MSGLLYPELITTLLVDDEEMAIHRLRKALQHYPQINIIGEARDGAAAPSLASPIMLIWG